MIAIHPLHRRLAEIVHMATDRDGNLVVGPAEIGLIMPLLRQNLLLVRQLDQLKELSMIAYDSGDMDWLQDICRRIDQLEATCL